VIPCWTWLPFAAGLLLGVFLGTVALAVASLSRDD
jgi:hypothetical protein